MGMSGNRARVWLLALVVAHLLVAIVHGQAHSAAHVSLSRAATLYVYTVILAGPLAGAALMWRTDAIGTWLVAATMAGAFVFGVVNHFVLLSPDHVSQVDAASRAVFATTAVLLAVTEAAASLLAFRVARERTGS